jgi:cell division protein YceG involved in septum cleavage
MTEETFFATLRLRTSPYYYYLHDDTGAIRYGRTLAEHNENRRIYLGK